MIVSILLAYLDKIGQRRHFREVFEGVGAAMVLVGVGGVSAYLLLTSYAGSRVQTIFETATYLLAAAVLTYMTFWMRNHARSMSTELRARAEEAMDGRARWGLRLLAFQSVGREGLETMVFTLAIVFASSGRGVIAGGLVGLGAALVFAFALYRLGSRINIGGFFRIVGALLMVFAAGILADAVQNLQQLGWLPILGRPLWSTAGLLSEDSAVGDVFHSFFGYADQPSSLQLVIYVLYLTIVVGAFFSVSRRPGSKSSQGRSTPLPS